MRYLIGAIALGLVLWGNTASAAEGRYGAVAMSPDGKYGATWNYDSQSSAEADAYASCNRKTTKVCSEVSSGYNIWILGLHCTEGAVVVSSENLPQAMYRMSESIADKNNCVMKIKIHTYEGRP